MSRKIADSRVQHIMSEPSRIFVEEYTTKSGDKKNRYKDNPNARHVKTIQHVGEKFAMDEALKLNEL